MEELDKIMKNYENQEESGTKKDQIRSEKLRKSKGNREIWIK